MVGEWTVTLVTGALAGLGTAIVARLLEEGRQILVNNAGVQGAAA